MTVCPPYDCWKPAADRRVMRIQTIVRIAYIQTYDKRVFNNTNYITKHLFEFSDDIHNMYTVNDHMYTMCIYIYIYIYLYIYIYMITVYVI